MEQLFEPREHDKKGNFEELEDLTLNFRGPKENGAGCFKIQDIKTGCETLHCYLSSTGAFELH